MNAWESFDAAQMAEFLTTRLGDGLPGRAGQHMMAPRLAYGRHYGPVPDDARRAAVLLALHRAASGWSVPAILRPDTMKAHAGQVSLPGGLIETDETVVQSALREFEEELGTAAQQMEIIGQLTPVYVFVSGFEVTPVIAVNPGPLVFQPNEHEVAAVVELPLAELIDPTRRGHHTIERRGLQFTVPHFAIAGQRVWGATSLILAEFLALLSQ
ncbi:MAG TPA: CoA pyrophosphatase [Pirellulaceae bacterium]|jgi:8-oxo-dGTP pyrophosphatase MutT (NUDIX family)